MTDRRLDDFAPAMLDTRAYPKCRLGITESGWAHDFEAVIDANPPLLFCRQCGQVRPLEVEEN
jgi:hypothetical protein